MYSEIDFARQATDDGDKKIQGRIQKDNRKGKWQDMQSSAVELRKVDDVDRP
jgi:hypothetical protein